MKNSLSLCRRGGRFLIPRFFLPGARSDLPGRSVPSTLRGWICLTVGLMCAGLPRVLAPRGVREAAVVGLIGGLIHGPPQIVGQLFKLPVFHKLTNTDQMLAMGASGQSQSPRPSQVPPPAPPVDTLHSIAGTTHLSIAVTTHLLMAFNTHLLIAAAYPQGVLPHATLNPIS